jgi:hypothetical protein
MKKIFEVIKLKEDHVIIKDAPMSLSVHSIMAGTPFSPPPLLLPLCKGLGGYLLLVF